MSSWLPSNARGSAPEYVPAAPHPWRYALVLFAAVLVQATIAPLFALRGAVVGFVLLAVLWYALRTNAAGGLLVGAIGGACEDALAGTGGAWTIATALAGAAMGRFARTWLGDVKLALAPAVALLTFVRYALFVVVLGIERGAAAAAHVQTHAALVESALNALVALALLTLYPSLGRYGARRV